MTQTGPGKSYRKGISLVEAVAESWFIETRWPDGVRCPFCESGAHVKERKNRAPQPYNCKACRKDFSVTTNTLMHGSKLPLGTWAVAFLFYSAHLKGVSSMKVHRDLSVTQKTAWHLAHRIRETLAATGGNCAGPVEASLRCSRRITMPRRKKERGRPMRTGYPPRIEGTAAELAQAMLSLPAADHEWEYAKGSNPSRMVYRCADCDREVFYPETLYRDGRCDTCRTPLKDVEQEQKEERG